MRAGGWSNQPPPTGVVDIGLGGPEGCAICGEAIEHPTCAKCGHVHAAFGRVDNDDGAPWDMSGDGWKGE